MKLSGGRFSSFLEDAFQVLWRTLFKQRQFFSGQFSASIHIKTGSNRHRTFSGDQFASRLRLIEIDSTKVFLRRRINCFDIFARIFCNRGSTNSHISGKIALFHNPIQLPNIHSSVTANISCCKFLFVSRSTI